MYQDQWRRGEVTNHITGVGMGVPHREESRALDGASKSRILVLVSQAEDLTLALEHIQACWEVCKTLKASGTASENNRNRQEVGVSSTNICLNGFEGNLPADPTDSLLLLYEFEARAKLSDPKVETILESVLELEHVETKVLETMAG